jgi:hypothetical protein
MKVKIGDKIYDSEEQPIMVVLSPADKKNIGNMDHAHTKYCSYTCKGFSEEEIEEFMEIE